MGFIFCKISKLSSPNAFSYFSVQVLFSIAVGAYTRFNIFFIAGVLNLVKSKSAVTKPSPLLICETSTVKSFEGLSMHANRYSPRLYSFSSAVSGISSPKNFTLHLPHLPVPLHGASIKICSAFKISKTVCPVKYVTCFILS